MIGRSYRSDESNDDIILGLIKYTFIIGNITVFIFTLIIIGLSILFLLKFGPFDTLNIQTPKSTITVLILFCIIAALITFFGWYGAYKLSPGLLYLYGVVLIILSFVQIFAIVSFGSFSRDIDIVIPELAKTYQVKVIDVGDGHSVTSEGIMEIHTLFQCCGWENTTGFDTLPKSCCPGKDVVQCTTQEMYRDKCSTVLLNLVRRHSSMIIASCILIIITEFIAVVASCGIARVTRLE